MNSWYRVTRTDWIVQKHFNNRWIRAGSPKDAALFGRIDMRAQTRTFYFNPAAALMAPDLLEIYHALECPAPNISTLALLVGDSSNL